jgi:hypothetical protein
MEVDVPVICNVPVVNPLYTVPSSMLAVISSYNPPPVLLCHLTVGVGIEDDAAVKLAFPGAHTETPVGCVETAMVPVMLPIAKSPNEVMSLAEADIDVGVPFLVKVVQAER